MMNWFYKWLARKIYNARSDEKEDEYQQVNLIGTNRASRPSRVRESDNLASEPIQFKMFKASGGWAIEFRQYDRKTDNVDTHLYVVNDEEELGKSLAHIITMEALKR